jgi:hypothetical protein
MFGFPYLHSIGSSMGNAIRTMQLVDTLPYQIDDDDSMRYVENVVQGRICVYRRDPSSLCIIVLFALHITDKSGVRLGFDTCTLGCCSFSFNGSDRTEVQYGFRSLLSNQMIDMDLRGERSGMGFPACREMDGTFDRSQIDRFEGKSGNRFSIENRLGGYAVLASEVV